MSENLTIVRPNGTEFSVDMTELRRLEGRQSLAAGVGRMEALALMSDMKDGYEIAGTLKATLGLELDRAKSAANMRRAIVYLDVVPDVLRAKGVASARSPGGSEEQREAVLALDKESAQLQDYTAQIQSARELMAVKMEGFRMTYSTVKRNFDDQLPGMLPRNYNGGALQEPRPARDFLPNRQHSTGNPQPGLIVPSQTAPTSGENINDYGVLIGKARY